MSMSMINATSRILGESVRPPTERELMDPYDAYRYASQVLKGRWPEGEPVIATDPGLAYQYATDVIGGRFPEAEATIAKWAAWAYQYAKDVIGGRWPEAEAVIAKSRFASRGGKPVSYPYEYAKDVIGGRWPEAEATIAKSPYFAYKYAKDVIGGRWPEAEAVIATDPRYNELYTHDVINGLPDNGHDEISSEEADQKAVDDLPVLSHSRDESFKYYVWYLSDGAAYPGGFNILLLFSGSQKGQLLRAVLRGEPLSTDLDFDFLNFEGKITEDDEAYSKPIVHSIIQRSQTDGDWTDVVKGSTLYYTLVKAVQTVYTVDEYDGWPLGLSNPGKIKELTPSLAKRLLSLLDL